MIDGPSNCSKYQLGFDLHIMKCSEISPYHLNFSWFKFLRLPWYLVLATNLFMTDLLHCSLCRNHTILLWWFKLNWLCKFYFSAATSFRIEWLHVVSLTACFGGYIQWDVNNWNVSLKTRGFSPPTARGSRWWIMTDLTRYDTQEPLALPGAKLGMIWLNESF